MSAEDAPAPSLSVVTDPEVPVYRLAVSVDVLGPLFDQYTFRLEKALSGSHALWLAPSVLLGDQLQGAQIEAGYHLWFAGEGVMGPYLGPSVAVLLLERAQREVAVSAAIELGYQHIWDGLVIRVGVGAGYEEVLGGAAPAWVGRGELALGYAFL